MKLRQLILIACLLGIHITAIAVPTRLVIRAKAKDAKFIGSSIGGAYVKVSEVLTGKLLASGYTHGSTGVTDIIMVQPHARFGRLTNDKTAAFTAMLDIEKPVLVEVKVIAPVNQRQAQITATTQLWMIPGKHVEGDGLIVEIPGMIVNVLAPQTHESIDLGDIKNGLLPVRCNIVMMCGCSVTEGGLWDSSDLEVKALFSDEDGLLSAVPMRITQKVNTFEGMIPVKKEGMYEITVYVYNAKTGNTGVDKVNVVVNE